jgi:hypothetical protein
MIYVMHHMVVIHELSTVLEDSSTWSSLLAASVTRHNASMTLSRDHLEASVSTLSQQNVTKNDQSSPLSRLPYVKYAQTFEEIRDAMDAGNDTAGQFLLDFGIIGFPKCGTTTMMHWLGSHPEIGALQREIMALQRQHPARLLRYILNELPEGKLIRGYKSPNDVEDQRALNKLAQHYPKTKLIVGLRHPVLWFESFYNHRVQNGMIMPKLMDVTEGCQNGYHGVCVGRAGFLGNLVRLGKTPLGYDNSTSTKNEREAEWGIFSKKEQRSLQKDLPVNQVSPNPIFVYDTSQLKVPNIVKDSPETISIMQQNHDKFVQSLKAYLGVSLDFPPMIQRKPGRTDLNATEQARRNALKVDICSDVYQKHRNWLLDAGKRNKEWILGYFVKSPGVVVGNRNHFREILDYYDVDPCIERKQKTS